MERIKLKMKTPMVGRLFNGVALFVLITSVINVIYQWSSLPEQVPSHYNIQGEPDAWSDKGFIFVPMIIGSILWIGMHLLEKFPHIHNYIGLTEENAERLYRNSMLLLNFIKNEILIIFALGSWNDIRVANGNGNLLGFYDFPLFLLIIFGTLIFFIIRSVQLQKPR